MTDDPERSEAKAAHWEHVYQGTDTSAVSWYQREPSLSLELIDLLEVGPESATVDVGGGASVLVDTLLARGFTDLTVLDISPTALQAARQRVGDDAPVTWLAEDLLAWEPTRIYDLWHDRAVFHFLSGQEVDVYRSVLRRAVPPGGAVIVATFALDGPERCSGLPVTRYGPIELQEALGGGLETVVVRREVHRTPGGTMQPFTWIAARRTPV